MAARDSDDISEMNVRSGGLLNAEEIKQSLFVAGEQTKNLKQFESDGMGKTTFFTHNSPDFIEQILEKVLEELGIEFVLNDEKYNIKLEYEGQSVKIRTSQVNDQQLAVEFIKIGGSAEKLYGFYKKITDTAAIKNLDDSRLDNKQE